MSRHCSSSFESLPQDLSHEILSRLPSRMLGVVKCLCNELSQPLFASQHLSRMQQSNSKLFLTENVAGLRNIEFVRNFAQDGRNVRGYIFPDMPAFDYVATVNGLVLKIDLDDHMWLWNPITDVERPIPQCEIHFPADASSCTAWYGLGYDPHTNDYIIYRIAKFDTQGWQNEVALYRTTTNEWKIIDSFPYNYCEFMHGVFVHGNLHWQVYSNGVHSISYLSLASEKWFDLEGPSDEEASSFWTKLGAVSEEKLILFSTYYVPDFQYNIWILHDYFNPKSWSRYRLRIGPTVRDLGFSIYLHPILAISPTEVLFHLHPHGRFGVFNLDDQVFYPVDDPALPWGHLIKVSFWESIVSPF